MPDGSLIDLARVDATQEVPPVRLGGSDTGIVHDAEVETGTRLRIVFAEDVAPPGLTIDD